ncbi:MAG: NAD(P)/FAD-dependent oxidoreductase [Cyclobacteriaceae bacterium]
MTDKSKHIAIVGGGLVGSLLSIYLSKRGYRVSVFERREDLRKKTSDEGRSINLALSTRGITALDEVGLGAEIKNIAIPMHGRMMHGKTGALTFLAYGKQGQYINSISRSGLNGMLMYKAEENSVSFFFQHRCTHINPDRTSATFQTGSAGTETKTFDVVIGADGAFSAVRSAMQIFDRFNYSQDYLEHGYKELHIPADVSGNFVLEKNALHIWPRESFMMIALPNPDGSFTCTLFFPFEGKVSFASLVYDHDILSFFNEVFPDALKHMPHLLDDFRSNPTSSLVTIKCFPWVRNKTFLIGDAAHGIVPFYGQGMNAGFEDCRILNGLLDKHEDQWSTALQAFQEIRKKDCDAIAQLAVDNFIEMRDLVADPEFLLRKKIEAKLHDLYPDKWIPLYSMVTFNEQITYSKAYRTGKKQEKIMDKVMKKPGIARNWSELDFQEIVNQLT